MYEDRMIKSLSNLPRDLQVAEGFVCGGFLG